ncbi:MULTISPECIES: GNAT family N-acetyltransferase [unclassified Paenibacillus]|uniref:GNAT family N-acetyltransferase n=1 Tax=unclassified Paenibacillus TaxID=185978 RepID=UPI00311980AE
MNTQLLDPYTNCPVYETERFTVRKVLLEDAADLLKCYADPVSMPLFNSDNCHTDFKMSTVDEMRECIHSWLEAYQRRAYVRFSIVDKRNGKAVGTIEFFSKNDAGSHVNPTGILRLDLASKYEDEDLLCEMIGLPDGFRECFEFEGILTKAMPLADQRIGALQRCGYRKVKNKAVLPYDYYYIKEFSRML